MVPRGSVIPVENDTHVTRVRPREDGLLELEIAGGGKPSIVTRQAGFWPRPRRLGEPVVRLSSKA